MPTTPTRGLYPDLATLLAPATLSAIEGRAVTHVGRRPFHSVDSLSGSQFLAIETRGPDGGPRRYVVKRIAHERDWLMRATGDRHGRATLAWAAGVYDRLPGVIEHGVVACAHDGAGQALLMRDLGAALVPPGDAPVGLETHARFLDAMAELHAAWWQDAARVAAERGFCSLQQHYHALTPATVREEADGTPRTIVAGWAELRRLVAPDVADVIGALLDNPEQLCAALRNYPTTLVHGDWKYGNLGLLEGPAPRVVLLDWDRVGEGPATLDLAWYLAVNAARAPEDKEAAMARYRAALAARLGAAFDEAWWTPQLALGLLGGFLQLGWPKLYGAAHGDAPTRARERAELEWWSERVREGARWL